MDGDLEGTSKPEPQIDCMGHSGLGKSSQVFPRSPKYYTILEKKYIYIYTCVYVYIYILILYTMYIL